jgi:hypothetical protein
MGKKRRRATKKTCSCGAVVSIFASSCSKCGNAFKSASTLEKRSRGAKKRAAVAASVADERTAAAVAATEQAPRFLPDSSKSPVASTKLGLLDILRLEPNIHPGTPEGLPEYVATRIISFLVCPDTDAKRVYEPPYVDYYAGLVTRCELERRPSPRLPRPDYVIREARDGLHSDVQALYVACGHGFATLVGTRGIEVGGQVIECMPQPYEPSKTAFGVVARHCASGLFGARVMVVSDGVKVATAIVSGARHLYPLESSDLRWRYSLKLLNRCAPTKDKSELGGAPAYGFVRQSYDDRGLARRASKVRSFTSRGTVNEHLMVYSFVFERLKIKIPEGLPLAPPGLLTEEHFGVGHSYCTLIRHFGERLEKQSKLGVGPIDEDTAWWNEIGV